MAQYVLYVYLLGSLLSAAADPIPFGMTWSSKSFGPDGPWQAVQVDIGEPAQSISLYPGGTFRSHLLASNICSNSTLTPGACFATAGGVFNLDASSTALSNVVQFEAATDFTHGGLNFQGAGAVAILDQIDIGKAANRKSVIVPNVTLALHDDVAAVYPGGTILAPQVGTLALGYLGTINQTFVNIGSDSINGSLIPGFLKEEAEIPSNSFGLHIGSVRAKIGGSLYFGGYDQNRICGDITTQNGGIAGIEPDDDGKAGLIDLLDIGLNVMEGSSPWNVSKVENLLSAGNSSIGTSLSVVMLPEAPYLDLPQSTCDAIAAWLPVTYRKDLGLYTWNTDDPLYSKIVSSPSILSFVFRKDQSNTQNITINVPFMLLNLTLDVPLVNSPTPYFPCNAESHGKYSLGRSFLQAAFIGQNWNVNNAQGVWWLAQAPGPNFGSGTNVQSIKEDDTKISSSSNDWATSWEGSWKALTGSDTAVNSTTSGSKPPPNSTDVAASGKASSSLSTGVKAAIAIGATVLGVLIIALVAFFFWRHRRQARKREQTEVASSTPSQYQAVGSNIYSPNGTVLSNGPAEKYWSGSYGPSELSGGRNPVELNGRTSRPVYEMRG